MLLTVRSLGAPDRPVSAGCRIGGCICVAAIACFGACSSVRVTDPPRTATEQFLLSQAAGEAVAQLSFAPLRGRDVFVDAQYFAAASQEFVLGELRARLLLEGVRLRPKLEEADVVLEVRSGGVGIDRRDFLLGIPALQLTTEGEDSLGNVPVLTPELAVLKNIDQDGIASVAYVAYWRTTGEVVASSGPFVGRTRRDDWWYFGVGPNTSGDIPPARDEPQAPSSQEPAQPAAGPSNASPEPAPAPVEH